MADFEFDASDLFSTQSIVNKVGSQFYPNGEVVIKNTTMSRLPMQDRTLRSADPAKILQGDGLFRNPAFATAAYAQSTQSALHGILAAQADIDDEVKIADPDDPTNSKYLTGAAARSEIMKQSIMTTGLAPGGFEATIRAMNETVVNSTTLNTNSGSFVSNEYGSTYSHSTSGYISAQNAEAFNGGSRPIALEEVLTDKEKEIYQTKTSELNKKVNFQGSISTFSVDFNKNKQNQDLTTLGFDIYQGGTFFGGLDGSLIPVPKQYIGAGSKTCYVSAALIELLLQLTNTIYISGGQGTDRTIVSSNFGSLTAENNSVSDHSFGRGFDISVVADTVNTAVSLVSSLDAYRRGLDIFLSALQKLPRELHPDLIIVHDQLASELGILEKGLEDSNSAVRVKYKGLSPYINFACDSSHRNHIHISFSPQRSGSFLTPSMVESLGQNTYSSLSASSEINFDKFKINYFDNPNEALSPDEIFNLLITTGIYSPEVAAIFTGIAERESNFKPGQLNTNRKTKDFSVGLFQNNLLPAAGGKRIFYLKYPNDANILGLSLAYAVEQGLSQADLENKVNFTASRSTVDQRIFIPYNQAYMIAVTSQGEVETAKRLKNNTQFDIYMFYPWGDYKGTYGFINKVKFSTISEVYIGSGKKIETLKSWIRKNFKNNKPFPYIEDWMNGEYYQETI